MSSYAGYRRCPWCRQVRAVYVPEGGEGSAVRMRRHLVPAGVAGGACEGSFETFTSWSETAEEAGEIGIEMEGEG